MQNVAYDMCALSEVYNRSLKLHKRYNIGGILCSDCQLVYNRRFRCQSVNSRLYLSCEYKLPD